MNNKLLGLLIYLSFITTAIADDVGCITTSWKLIGDNHKVCVQAFSDPKISGVICHISQARKGGLKGTFGIAEDPAKFSLSCRQIGKISFKEKIPKQEVAFNDNTSILFKETKVTRIFDKKRNTLVYVAISKKLIDGSPVNSISTVPLRSW